MIIIIKKQKFLINLNKNIFQVWKNQQTPKEPDYTVNDFITAITGPKGDKGDTGPQGPAGPDGKDGDGKSWWEYLLSYGLSGASAAASIGNIVAVQSQIEALQAQIAVIEGEIMTIIGQDTAEAFADAVADAANTSTSLGQAASNVFQSIANVFRNITANLQTARNGATQALNSMRAAVGGYQHLV